MKERDPTTRKWSGRDRQKQLVGLFVVLGAAAVFGPLLWLLERWREAVARDPASAWGAPWLGEQLSAHPYPTVGVLLLLLALSSGLVMLRLLGVSRWLAARLTDSARSD